MAKVEHDITTLVMAHRTFYADRPNIARHNRVFSKIVRLSSNEIAELNGHAEDGMTREKYREQEISDIVWFTLGMLEQIGVYPSDGLLMDIAAETGIQPPVQYREEPREFSLALEARYRGVKSLMEDETDALSRSDFQGVNSLWQLNRGQRQRLLNHLHRILGYAWALFHLMEVNPYDAVMEKMARNMLKHKHRLYSDPSKTYEEGKAEADHIWKEKERGNLEFYGSMTSVGYPQETR